MDIKDMTLKQLRAEKMRELGEGFRPWIDAVDAHIAEHGWPKNPDGTNWSGSPQELDALIAMRR
jgi:hypothetical protein